MRERKNKEKERKKKGKKRKSKQTNLAGTVTPLPTGGRN
jgi:hypothetical protein